MAINSFPYIRNLYVKIIALSLFMACEGQVKTAVETEASENRVIMAPVCRMAFYQEVPFEEAVSDPVNVYIMRDKKTMLAYFSCIKGYDFTKTEAWGMKVNCEGLGYPMDAIVDPRFPLHGCLFQFLEQSEFQFTTIVSWEQMIAQMIAAGWLAP